MKKQDEEKSKIILDRVFEDALMDMIEKYPSPEELKGTQKFSAEHEKKMRDIIESAQKREQQKSGKRNGRLLRTVMNVAAAFGILCFLGTLMAFTVPPVRIALQNYFMTSNEEYLEVQAQVDEDEFVNEVYNFPTYIPSGFELENTQEGGTFLMVLYTNETDRFIRLERFVGVVDITVDTENAEHSEFDVQGKRAQLVIKNGIVNIVFINSEYTFAITTDISEDEAIKIAESISEKK